MEASELRIGNWLAYLGGDNFQVSASDISLIESMPGYLHPLPIALTEEWLLRFGFSGIEYWHKKNFTFRINIRGPKFYLVIEDDIADWVELRFVHQLQNLYFALTGEELKINEQRKEQP